MAATTRAARRGGYETEREDVQALVPRSATRILDLGCASGALGGALKRRQGAEVVGIELDPEYARDAEERLDLVVCADVVAGLDEDLGDFDCLVAADVLEHLVDPWDALRRAVGRLRPGGAVVVSLPNVRYWETFRELGWRGRWPRRGAGLFDATHLRWFALADMRELLEQAGIEVVEVSGQLWFEGRLRRPAELLARTPLAPFLYGQYVLRGVRR
ncbi:MAG TPA: class I SAM-dependent methyltransferase [Solirubrobacteraceae bacterium]|jgi:SAM-dependent methyltransferase|nr:class I SAM-dependent methyltransferase [Solirubrobacteraceae bacterium]